MTTKQKTGATIGLMIIGLLNTVAAEKMFTIFTVPDTQRGQHNIAPMFEWIGQQKEAMNVVAVVSLGDMTDANRQAEWDVVKNGYEGILWQKYGIRYVPCMGNHDSNYIYTPESQWNGIGMQNAFPVSLMEQQGMLLSTMEGTTENAEYKFSIYGINYTIVTIADFEQGGGRVQRSDYAKGIMSHLTSADIGMIAAHDPGWVPSFDNQCPHLDFMCCGHHGNESTPRQYSFPQYQTGHYWTNGQEDWSGRAIAYTFYPDQNVVKIQERGPNGEVRVTFPDLPLVMNPTSDNGTIIPGGTRHGNAAEFIAQSISDIMDPGGTYPVTVTMKNTGTNTWSAGNSYSLGSENLQDNSTWGMGRVTLPAGNPDVVPDEEVTFAFNVTAPSQAGVFDFQWKMVQDGEEWFGALTENRSIKVGLTDSTSNLGTITHGGVEVSSHENEFMAFDDDVNTKFLSRSQSAYLQYQYANEARFPVVAYSLTSANDVPARDPVDVVLKGSQDGASWTTLDSRTGIVYPGRFETVAFSADNSIAYAYYRLEMSNNGADDLMQIGEVELLRPRNIAPRITSTPSELYIEGGESYSYTVLAEDAEGDAITLSCVTDLSSSWLNFSDGVLSGHSSENDIGSHSITLRASDTNSYSDQSFNITVSKIGNDAPVIRSVTDTGVLENQTYSYTIVADDADGDSLTYSEVTTPGWLTFSGSVLSGTAPAGSSLGLVSLSVNDGTVSVTQTFNVAVFATPLPDNLMVNGSFETGNTSGWTIAAPTEATVSAELADAEGTYSLKYTAEADGYIPPTSQPITVRTNTNYILKYSINRASKTAGALSVKVNPNVRHEIYYDATAGWESKQISFNSGSLTEVTVEMYADGNLADTIYLDEFSLAEPEAGNTAPVITSIPVTNATVGAAYSYTLTAADVDGYPLTFSPVILPSGFRLDAGVLSGTPSAAGTLDVELNVEDGQDGSDTQRFVITVAGALTGYDIWAATHAIIGGPLDDPDGNGLDNLSEYAVGEKSTITQSGNIFCFVHNERTDDPNLSYLVQTCTNLVSSIWTNAGYVVLGTNVTGGTYNEVTNSILMNDAQSYFRVKISDQ
jgi:hypothetical protein